MNDSKGFPECYEEFIAKFANDLECRRFLCALKWDKGFLCRKCNHPAAVRGRTWYFKKCQRCQYDESCTAFTLFHKVKFPLYKAFRITYELVSIREILSISELSERHSINSKTAAKFKKKVKDAIELNQVPFGLREWEVSGGYSRFF
jgi:hypothetical protein